MNTIPLRVSHLIVVCFSLLVAWDAFAVDLPSAFTVPAGFKEDASRRKYADFDTSQFDFMKPGEKNNTHLKVEGRLWRLVVSSTTNPKANTDATILALAEGLRTGGWDILRQQGVITASRKTDAGAFWLSGNGSSSYFSLVVMQESGPSRALTLTPPAKDVEKLNDAKDFPFAQPLPGSKFLKTQHDPRPFEVALPGGPSLFVNAKATKWYQEPAGVSSFEFVAIYRQALEAAGWVVTRGAVAGDAVVIAHYGKDGRDIWLYTRGDGSQQSISIADNGEATQETALQKQLREEGHVALYGIYFDTDISIPRPESGPTLQHILELLQNDTALSLEVQGHTDSTGTVEHNEKLSAARAASVRQWLADHGIAAGRLTSKGYASTKPVADNKSPEGRAKNRRVEIAKQ